MRLKCSVPCAVPVTSGSICMEEHVQLKRFLCMEMPVKHKRAVSERQEATLRMERAKNESVVN